MAIPGIPRHIPRDTRIDDIIADLDIIDGIVDEILTKVGPCPVYKGASQYNGNPGDGVKQTVLNTTMWAVIHVLSIKCTWTVQPDNIQIHTTLDGSGRTATFNDPVSGKWYFLSHHHPYYLMKLTPNTDLEISHEINIRVKSVKVECEINGGTYSNLQCLLYYSQFE